MNAPKRVTVKDIIRGYRQQAKAVAAGFADSEEGLAKYREVVFRKYRRRHESPAEQLQRTYHEMLLQAFRPTIVYDPALLAQADMRKLGQPGATIGIDMRTASGARIAGQSDALRSIIGNALGAAGTFL